MLIIFDKNYFLGAFCDNNVDRWARYALGWIIGGLIKMGTYIGRISW